MLDITTYYKQVILLDFNKINNVSSSEWSMSLIYL